MVHRRILSIAAVGSLTATLMLGAGAMPVAAAKTYANCTALNKVYHHGVGKKNAHDHVSSGSPVTNFYRSDALYNANASKDRDHDGVACEKH